MSEGEDLPDPYVVAPSLPNEQEIVTEAVNAVASLSDEVESGASDGPANPAVPEDQFTETDAKKYITELIAAGITGYHSATAALGSRPNVNNVINIKHFLRPNVLIWDLQIACPEVIERTGCPECGCHLKFINLRSRRYTRKLYGLEGMVTLVTSVLRCVNKQHSFLGYDPRILKHVVDQDQVPFILFHKAGLTKDVFKKITQLVIEGFKFNQVQEIIKDLYIKSYATREEAYFSALQLQKDESSIVQAFPKLKLLSPSNTLIGQCFISGFQVKEHYYKECMVQLLASEWIIIDTTFKLASNIGYSKPIGVWVNQFKGLVYIVNELGQVIAWQLTKSESFDDSKDIFISLKQRHERAGVTLKGCCIGNCCNWAEEIKAIFGEHFMVKHNLPNVIESIERKIPHQLINFEKCWKDFIHVFGDISISNDILTTYTSNPNILLINIDIFIKQWKGIKDSSGAPILPPSVIKLLKDLQQHIPVGCFSDIPAQLLKISLQELHCLMRHRLTNCRLGVPLASALFTLFFHEFNSSKAVVNNAVTNSSFEENSLLCAPAASGDTMGETSTESATSTHSAKTLPDNKGEASVKCSTNSLKFLDTIAAQCNLWRVEDGFENVEQLDFFETVLGRAYMFLRYYNDLRRFAPNVDINFRLVPFLTCALSLLHHPMLADRSGAVITKRTLADLRVEWKEFDILTDVQGTESSSGRNLFHSTALYLHHIMRYAFLSKAISDGLINHLSLLGVNMQMTADEIAILLENVVSKNVKEQAALRLQKRPDDVTSIQETEAESLVKELASFLGSVVTIFTSMEVFPIAPVFPRCPSSHLPNIFLLINERLFYPLVCKCAHVMEAVDDEMPRFITRCRCGRGGKTREKQRCTTMGNYICRCPCYRNEEGCNPHCDCYPCCNPHGTRPSKEADQKNVKRRRHMHNRYYNSREGNDPTFGYGAGSENNVDNWSPLEHFIFEAIIGEMTTAEESITTETVCAKFNFTIKNVMKIELLDVTVATKTVSDIQAKLFEREKAVDHYLQMYQKQIDINFNDENIASNELVVGADAGLEVEVAQEEVNGS